MTLQVATTVTMNRITPTLSYPASSSSCSSETRSVASPSKSIFDFLLFQNHCNSGNLLAACIRYLNQQERVCAARVNHHLYDACCHPDSWSSDDGVLYSVESSGEKSVQFSSSTFRFQGPSLRCTPSQLSLVKRGRVFANARCIELSWHDLSPMSDLTELNSWTTLENLYIGSGRSGSTVESKVGLHSLPDTLKSFTYVMSPSVANAHALVSILPPSLNTLQIIFNVTNSHNISKPIVLFEKHALKRLPMLKLLILRVSMDPQSQQPPKFDVDFLGLTTHHLDALRIRCEITPLHLLLGTALVYPIATPPQTAWQIFGATLSHLRLEECGVFDYCESVNWSTCLPSLTSLFIERFSMYDNSTVQSCIPPELGKRIKLLSIRNLMICSGSGSYSHCFARNGLTNLTSLTFKDNYHPNHHLLDELSSLTHLSFERPAECELHDFAQLHNLKRLKITSWPSSHLRQHLDARPCKVEQLSDDGFFDDGTSSPINSLADIFPSLIELTVVPFQGEPISCFDAREFLRTIPLLKSIKWDCEPLLHPNEIESYYSMEAINMRQSRLLQQIRDERRIIASRWREIATIDSHLASPLMTTIARNFNACHLVLVFQSLSPLEVARVSQVSKHWCATAVNPMAMRSPICVTMNKQGVSVKGPQVQVHSLLRMFQACNSAVFRNIRILSLGVNEHPTRLPRESLFAQAFLRMFAYVPHFHSLHTLTLNWTRPDYNHHRHHHSSMKRDWNPTVADAKLLHHVMGSHALENLKVFRITAVQDVIQFVLQFVPKLQALEVVEIRYDGSSSAGFASPLLKLPFLKQVYLYTADHSASNRSQGQRHQFLKELHEFCSKVSPNQFEEIFCTALPSDLDEIAHLHCHDNTSVFKHMRSHQLGEFETFLQYSVARRYRFS